MAERTKKTKTLEESFTELEEIADRMEKEDISLEESFALYKKGMALLKKVNAGIDRVEKEVKKLNSDGSLTDLEAMQGSGFEEAEGH